MGAAETALPLPVNKAMHTSDKEPMQLCIAMFSDQPSCVCFWECHFSMTLPRLSMAYRTMPGPWIEESTLCTISPASTFLELSLTDLLSTLGFRSFVIMTVA